MVTILQFLLQLGNFLNFVLELAHVVGVKVAKALDDIPVLFLHCILVLHLFHFDFLLHLVEHLIKLLPVFLLVFNKQSLAFVRFEAKLSDQLLKLRFD